MLCAVVLRDQARCRDVAAQLRSRIDGMEEGEEFSLEDCYKSLATAAHYAPPGSALRDLMRVVRQPASVNHPPTPR